MGRIEPVPWDELPDESRALIEAGLATGMYTTPVPMQIVAYSSAALRSMHDGYTATFRKGILDDRLVELLRLRSAEAGGCATCMASRKDPTVSDDDTACLMDPDPTQFSPRELAALGFFDRLAYDHTSIGPDTYRELSELFTTAEIVELGYLCAFSVGIHRLMHTWDLGTEGEPVLHFESGAIDRTHHQ